MAEHICSVPNEPVISENCKQKNFSLDSIIQNFCEHLSPKTFLLLFAIGLIVRIPCSFLYGTQDMEWWKAWGTYSTQQSIFSIYSNVPDKDIISMMRAGNHNTITLKEGFKVLPSQTIIPYSSNRYFRTEYIVTQPPLYIYSIYMCTKLYKFISNNIINNRIFNFFLNIEPIVSSALIASLLSFFISSLTNNTMGRLVFLTYWLNPLVILNSPIQAYRDPLYTLLAVLSVIMLYRKNLIGTYIFLVFAFMYKPTGILIAPIIFFVGLYEHSIRRNIQAWAIACVTFFVISLPYIITNHFLGMVQGVLSITQSSNDLSRSSMNIWWPVQYITNAYVLITQEGVSSIQALTGHDFRVRNDLPIRQFESITHINAGMIGIIFLVLFTIFNLYYVWKRLQFDRRVIFIASALQVYGYFILRAGVQTNHYFMLIPLLTLTVFLNAISLRDYLMICSVFFVQDLMFYGFGRDFNHGFAVLSLTYSAWTTNILALINVGLFLLLCRKYCLVAKE